MRKKFNVKFFAMLVGVTALLAVGVHYLHGFQVKRNAKTLLDQAHEAQKAEHAYQASELYSAYLIYYPDDAATLAEYGALLEDLSARNPRLRSRASAVLDKALRLNRDADIETHRRAIKVAMSLGLFSDAKDHLSTLIKAAPDKGEFEYL